MCLLRACVGVDAWDKYLGMYCLAVGGGMLQYWGIMTHVGIGLLRGLACMFGGCSCFTLWFQLWNLEKNWAQTPFPIPKQSTFWCFCLNKNKHEFVCLICVLLHGLGFCTNRHCHNCETEGRMVDKYCMLHNFHNVLHLSTLQIEAAERT